MCIQNVKYISTVLFPLTILCMLSIFHGEINTHFHSALAWNFQILFKVGSDDYSPPELKFWVLHS